MAKPLNREHLNVLLELSGWGVDMNSSSLVPLRECGRVDSTPIIKQPDHYDTHMKIILQQVKDYPLWSDHVGKLLIAAMKRYYSDVLQIGTDGVTLKWKKEVNSTFQTHAQTVLKAYFSKHPSIEQGSVTIDNLCYIVTKMCAP